MSNKKRSPAVLARKSSVVATQVALAVMAQFAYAQQAERVERVEITGTRLPQLSTEGPSPVTVMDAQDIRMDGRAKAEDLLNTLPQVFAGQSSTYANGATGTATIDLRNLGPTRNLVLLNGRRMPAGSPRGGTASPAADLNQIPAPLIQRVEVLTGGASAVYGSDAITGVVNFIMNDRFEGLQIDLNHSVNYHQQQNPQGVSDIVAARAATNPGQFKVPGDISGGGRINGISLLMGRNFADNKGNATAYFQYKREDPIYQADYDYSACSLGTTGPAFACVGSSTTGPQGRFILNGGTGPSRSVADSAGTTRAFSAATDQFNFGPYNHFRRPSDQWAANAFVHLDVTPRVRAYGELGYHDNHSLSQIAPSGIFFLPETISFENPFLSADWRSQIAANNGGRRFSATGDTTSILVGRRNVEGGGRIDDIRHTSFRAVAGAKGEMTRGLNYDAYLQTGQVIYNNRYLNDFSQARIAKALDAVTDPATGNTVCRSFLNGTDTLCRPYNIWALGGVTQDALSYLAVPLVQSGSTRMHVVNGSLQADLGAYGIKMPGARDGFAVAFGVERRKEELILQSDVGFESGDGAGQGGPSPSVTGRLDVDEWFAEARLPLVQRQPFADLLSVNGSFRSSDYSTGKKADTYGFGAEWAPVRNYRLRGSYQRAIRHANIQELFQPQSVGLFGFPADPCGPTRSATAAQCANTGLPAALYGAAILDNPAGQGNTLSGGNPNLEPEEATTTTLGIVLNPVRNLNATIDWWSIKVDEAVGTIPEQTTLTQCLTAGRFCSLIQRDSLGTLWVLPSGRITATNVNVGGYKVEGIDLAVNYTTRIGRMGGLGINFAGTYTQKWEFEPIPNVSKFDCVGLFGPQCGTPNPKWRHKARFGWQTPWNVDLALTWRHIDAVDHEGTSSNTNLNDPTLPATDRKMDARDYFDLAANWTINKTFSLRAGVNNMFDTDPPVVQNSIDSPPVVSGNVYAGVYDILGRMVWLNLSMKF